MPMRLNYVFGLVLILSHPLQATNPFVGKWKIDEAKSHITGAIDSVKAAGPNTWEFEYGSFSWTVKANNTDQPTPFGTTALKVLNSTTWRFTNKSNGKPTLNETWVLSADNQTMTRTFVGKDENGQQTSTSATMKRDSGTTGFEGSWEITESQLPFTEIDIEPNGDDGITVYAPVDGTTYSLKFDGKDYPEHGPRIPAGVTVSARMTGPRTVHAFTKLNGKVFDNEDWEISADGMTYTYTQHDAGTDNPAVIILHRSE
jgi:hypothetical protein